MMATLPRNFQFSQASLQDYADCRRRFQLRYLEALAWPAIEAEPADEHEARLRQGELFHRLVYQHELGIPADRLARMFRSADQSEGTGGLAAWWEHYLESPPPDLPAQRYVEITLSAPLGGHRLVAKYDLIAVDPGQRAVIVDWKTWQARPARPWLVSRLQTRVYRYLLVRAGAPTLRGQEPLQPDQVEMVYWFANHPDQPERLHYSETEYRADGDFLAALVGEIALAGEDDFPLTDDVRQCRFCTYRSLCDRGLEAGRLEAFDAEEEASSTWETGFDFEQIAEIEF
jgi:PD-(D/E)XK nuclease superfamily